MQDKEVTKAFYGLTVEALTDKIQDNKIRKEVSAEITLYIDELLQNYVLDNGKPIVDWQFKTNITGNLLIEIEDYLMK